MSVSNALKSVARFAEVVGPSAELLPLNARFGEGEMPCWRSLFGFGRVSMIGTYYTGVVPPEESARDGTQHDLWPAVQRRQPTSTQS